MPKKKMLVAGASGLVGFAAVKHFAQLEDWDVVGVSRRIPDGLEGAKVRNAFGTYLHGAVLPKNPRLADRLIALALERRYGPTAAKLAPLDDRIALRAHAEALHAALSSTTSALARRFAQLA